MACGPRLAPEAPGFGLLSSLSDSLATADELRLLQALRRELAAELAETPGFPDVVGDTRLLRTLRGFDHCLAEAAAAFRAHLEIRREHGLDAVRAAILERWGDSLWDLRCEMLPHGDVICRYMPEVLVFGRATTGDPVGLGLWGRGRPGAFVREVEDWQDKFLEYYCFMNEARMLLLDQASREQGRLAHFVQVFDLDSWSVMGNADRSWSSFTGERAGLIGETYHDCNVNFLAIRTTRMARMAYNMIKGWWPKKVTDKVHIFGDDFRGEPYLSALLGGQTLDLLHRRSFLPSARCQEGRASVRPRQHFELRVDVPHGGRLRWKFRVKQESHRRCLWGPPAWACSELEFSMARAGDEAPLPGGSPRRVAGDSIEGCLERIDGVGGFGATAVVLRWDNTHALLTSKSIQYRVEVDVPAAAGQVAVAAATALPAGAPSKEGVTTLWFALHLCLVVMLIALARLVSHFEHT